MFDPSQRTSSKTQTSERSGGGKSIITDRTRDCIRYSHCSYVSCSQTLLHEMIHALLFVTQNNRDRDGHGPEFCKHMNRINQASGTKISVSVCLLIPLMLLHDVLLYDKTLSCSDLSLLPRRGGRVPAALVALQRPVSEPQAVLRLREEGDEPSTVGQRPMVGGPPENMRRNVHQDQRARELREEREERGEERQERHEEAWGQSETKQQRCR